MAESENQGAVRFLEAQADGVYEQALAELRDGLQACEESGICGKDEETGFRGQDGESGV